MKRHELITEILRITGYKRSLHPDIHFPIDRALRKYEETIAKEHENKTDK